MEQNALTSPEYQVWRIKDTEWLPDFVEILIQMPFFNQMVQVHRVGAVKQRLYAQNLMRIPVPNCSVEVQRAVISQWKNAITKAEDAEKAALNLEINASTAFEQALGFVKSDQDRRRFSAVWFSTINRWDVSSLTGNRSQFCRKEWATNLNMLVRPLDETTRRCIPIAVYPERCNYVGMENVEAITGRLIGFTPKVSAEIKSSCVRFNEDHILYGKLRPYLRKVFRPSEYGLSEGVASSEFITLIPRESVLPGFLAEVLRSEIIAEQAKDAVGARMPRISPQALLSFCVPLPPIDIQNELVTGITHARLTATEKRQHAKKIREQVKREVEAQLLSKTVEFSE